MREAIDLIRTINRDSETAAWPHPNPFVACILEEVNPALDCDLVAKTYASAANPGEDFTLALVTRGDSQHDCSGVFSAHGKKQRTGLEVLGAVSRDYEQPLKVLLRKN